MKLSIVSTNRCQVPVVVMPIGACHMAKCASLKGHEVRVLDLMFERSPQKTLRQHLHQFQPDCVGFSIRNIDNGDMYEPVSYWKSLPDLARCVRETIRGRLVIGGGAVSVMPREFLHLTGADWAIVGEGDTVLCECLSALEEGKNPSNLPGMATLKGGKLHLIPPSHAYPMCEPVAPEFSRWIGVERYQRQVAAFPVQTKRGCPRNCIYCTYPLLEGQCHRTADPVLVAERVMELGKSGAKEVEFVDNVFNDPREHAFAICEELIKQGNTVSLRTTDLSPRGLDDELLRVMRLAGFEGFGLTVESASNRVLEGLGKGYGVDELEETAEIVRNQEMPCMWIYMLGGPGETPDTVQRTLDFAESSLGHHDIAVFFPGLRIFPNTQLEKIAFKEGILPESGVDFRNPYFYLSSEVDKEWLIGEIKARARRVPGFLPPATRSFSLLPLVYRLANLWGFDPPFWQYTSCMRRVLKMLGI